MQIMSQLLQLMKYRSEYEKLRPYIKLSLLDKETKAYMTAFDDFFKRYPDVNEITAAAFVAMRDSLGLYEGSSPEEDDEYDLFMFETIKNDVPDDVRKMIIRNVTELNLSDDLEQILAKFKMDKLSNLYEHTTDIIDSYKRTLGKHFTDGGIDFSISDVLKKEETGIALQWELRCLRDSMHNLSTQKSVIIAARPDAGKTSFLCRQAGHMLHQTKGKTDRPLLWCNNEGKLPDIVLTMGRALLNKTVSEIKEYKPEDIDKMISNYIGGNDRVILRNVHRWDYRQIESLIEEFNPLIVIVDMLDNVRGFENAGRDDLRLEQLYIWLRDAAIIHDFLALPSSQLSQEAESIPYPDQSMLKDSRTGKAGACDGIITIGRVLNNRTKRDIRYIGCPKNKFTQSSDDVRPECQKEVIFDHKRAVFKQQVEYTGGAA